MKKFLTTIVMSAQAVISIGQSISTQTLNATGGSTVSSAIQLEWSFGELMAIHSIGSGELLLTQGLLQPGMGVNSPLPVKLLYFKGSVLNEGNRLTWATSQEINNLYFDLERSSDGFNFSQFRRISGALSSNSIKNYSLTDSLPHLVTWYRLKQVDVDGKFNYSPIVLLKSAEGFSFKLYPTITSGGLNLAGGIKEKLELSIYNTSGQLLLYLAAPGVNSVTIDVSRFPRGIYTVRVKGITTGKTWSGSFTRE